MIKVLKKESFVLWTGPDFKVWNVEHPPNLHQKIQILVSFMISIETQLFKVKQIFWTEKTLNHWAFINIIEVTMISNVPNFENLDCNVRQIVVFLWYFLSLQGENLRAVEKYLEYFRCSHTAGTLLSISTDGCKFPFLLP